MKAMILRQVAPISQNSTPLELVDLPNPILAEDEILVKVSACGVCHTELDEIEGRTAPPELPIVLGHEVIGRVQQTGNAVDDFQCGDRVGIGWIHCSSGDRDENLHPEFRATGRDAHGGYAEYMTIGQTYAYPIPKVFSDVEAAPLLCAGAVGFRALRLANLSDGDLLGLTGFGGSAHLVLQVARQLYPRTKIFVFARGRSSQDFARELGADWAGDTADRAPEKLHAIIDTTPAWKPVVEALKNLRPGGRLVVNAIRKEDDDKDYLLQLSYHDHLWMEREIKSVANVTHYDIAEFLPVAAKIPLKPTVNTYRLEDANQALVELKQGGVRGAKVLVME